MNILDDTAVTAALQAMPPVLRDTVRAHLEAWRDAGVSLPAAAQTERAAGRLAQVLACSDFVARTGRQQPELLAGLIDSGDLARAYDRGDPGKRVESALSTVQDEVSLAAALRHIRAREMVRIAWRDLAGLARLDETVADLSALADACIDGALGRLYEWATRKHGTPVGQESGQPQRLAVLGMGKLGGRELNFSSDIDLIFCYPEEGACEQGLSTQEFFTRLGQALIRALNENTADGFVFRVDMRLRPNGDSGPLALSFSAMEHYYQLHGRDWERYAFIKARVVAGDRVAGAELLATLKPFVYRKYLDFGAIEAIRGMKVMIEREMARKGMGQNIKLGRGGIREIEFILQTHQLIRGGREPSLQEPNARRVLAALKRVGYLDAGAADRLDAAYVFLRDVEHRLQMADDRQTQRLPDDEAGRQRLAFAGGFPDWPAFLAALDGHRQAVHEQFNALFRTAPEPPAADPLAALWQGALEEGPAHRLLRQHGYDESGEVLELLQALRSSAFYQALSTAGRERVDRIVPMILAEAGAGADPPGTLKRLVQVLESIGRRTAYFALMAENPPVVKQLVNLAGASPWIASWIARHPLLLDELLNPALARLPVESELRSELRERIEQLPLEDLELQMEVLREFRHGHVLRVAAADLATKQDPLDTGSALALIADAVVSECLCLAERDLQRRHGQPRCPDRRERSLAVIGYGKLGSRELGYGSDLDMIFLYEGCSEGGGETDGGRPLPNESYFARLGQRLIHLLTTRTAGGQLYEVDMRLRPSGKSGPLVASLDSFEQYQTREAWTWEHQALVRARAVAGSQAVIGAFEKLRAAILCRPRDPETLKKDVRDMRARMLESHGSREAEKFDLKYDRGGIVDIEFMVQYWVLRWAAEHPALIRQTDNIHLLQALAGEGLLDPDRAAFLEEGYRRYLSLEHHLKLQERGSLIPAAELGDLPERVRQIWRDEFNEE